MTVNRFGGLWTATKLQVLREYLEFYTQALKAAPNAERPFQLLYLDAFAGTGRCHIKDGSADGSVIPGSAGIALGVDPPFHRYHFIEPKRAHHAELQALIDSHPMRERCRLGKGTAESLLPFILRGYDWRRHRGVLFLDPFGLQCDWSLLCQIADTKALDVFFLLSISGLYRQAAVDRDALNPGHAKRIDQVFGTAEWRDALYTQKQGDFFSGEQVTRTPGWEGLLQFANNRLTALFPYVSEPVVLGQANGAPLFALYFLVSNPSKKARELASRVSRDVLSKLR